jgi:molybdopterin molybdotransferase
LQSAVHAGGERQAFLWCLCVSSGEGYQVEVLDRQGSGQTRGIQGANALLSVPPGCPHLPTGERVEVLLLRQPDRS